MDERVAMGRDALAAGREMSGEHLAQAAVHFLDPPSRRVKIPFEGAHLVGILREPAGDGPHPVVIMVPGPGPAKEEFRSIEELFLARGLATCSVDGPGQGEAEYALAIREDGEVPGATIIDRLSAEPSLDEQRIAVRGISLGGYCAPRVAGGDERVRACVARAGPFNFADRRPRITGRAAA